MRANMDLRQLETFLAVAHYANFSTAAKSLHVSQPALSRTIRLMEDALGSPLFDRDTRTVTLTAVGEELLPIAKRVVGEFSRSMTDLAGFIEGKRGRIKLTTLPSLSQSILTPQLLADFQRLHPHAEFSLRNEAAGEVLACLQRGDADMALTVQPPPDGSFAFTHLFDDPYVLVSRRGHPLLTRYAAKTLPWRVFDEENYIASIAGSSIRAATDAVFMSLDLNVQAAHEASSLQLIGSLIAAGLGIAAIPASAVSLLNQGDLVARGLDSPSVSRRIGLVRRMHKELSPIAKTFYEYMQTQPHQAL